MRLHELTTKRIKRTQRVGRSGKRGTTAGRGQKGQKSRAGRRMRPAVRDLILRIPKHRGFRNKPVTSKSITVSLAVLVSKLKPLLAEKGGAVIIDRLWLKRVGIVPNRSRAPVKILGGSEVTIPLTIQDLPVSAPARRAIEKAGGKVISAVLSTK